MFNLVAVEAEWFIAEDAGESASAGVLDAVCEWLWGWWRLPSIPVWQVQKCSETSVYTVVFSFLALASYVD